MAADVVRSISWKRACVIALAICSLVGCYRSHQLTEGLDARVRPADGESDTPDAGPALACYPSALLLEYRGEPECVVTEVNGGDDFECEVPPELAESFPSLPSGRAVIVMNAAGIDARLQLRVQGVEACPPDGTCWAYMTSREDGDACGCVPRTLSDELPVEGFDYFSDHPLPAGRIVSVLLPNAAARYEVRACPPWRD